MEMWLERTGIISYFDFILSCESIGTGKSQPDAYLYAAELLYAQPQDIAVYEDAFFAVETAKKAGFYVVGVYDFTQQDKWEKVISLADETVDFD